jgi:predicted RND superfamily exporter protein
MYRALYTRLVARPGLVVLLSLLTAVPMGYFSVLLFANVRADIRELLPASARSVQTLRELERRFGGYSQLSMVVESPDPDANRRFSDVLVEAMRSHPSVRSIRNKIGTEKEFFKERKHLFVDLEDLETILERLEDAANDARARANPLLVDLDDKGPVELDLSDIEKKYSSKFELANRFPRDYFESQDQKTLAILLRKHGLAFGIDANLELITAVEAAIARIDPAKFHPEMRVSLGGDVKNIVEEHTSLIEDLALGSIIVAVLLALVVVVYYRRFRALYLISIPVIVGCAWTFGASYLLVGYLNASSAFLGPIVPGNGINFGLILLARYIEERRSGISVDDAVERAVRYTLKATGLVAVAASVAYGSLMATDFLGFKHFGIIGGIGMVFCWIATFLIMPPLILSVERMFPLDPAKELRLIEPGALARIPAGMIVKFATPIVVVGTLAGIISIGLSVRYLDDPFEKDFNKLRSKLALTSGSAQVAKKVDDIFGLYQEPQVIIAEKDEDVPLIVDALNQAIKEGGELGPLADVTALTNMVPRDQEKKLEVLKKIRAVLTDDLLSNLEPDKRKLAAEHRPPADLAPFTAADLPESVRADFRELDGREGRIVLALPNMKLNLYHADEIKRVADSLRAIRLPDGRIVESSGNFVIYADMVEAISRDGPRATAYSFIGVIILCLLAYRRIGHVAVVAGALLIGIAWLGALLDLFAIKINFLNFIALPITFGIGIDYAVNTYSRYRLERETKEAAVAVFDTISSTGGAVILCSITTVIGYASLLVARNGALISFGNIAVIGELTCLAAALLLMPAWLVVVSRRGKAAK